MRTIAIGDAHGCLGKLTHLIEQCLETISSPLTFVFLGDYIDRGPDSRGVIEYLMKLQTDGTHRVVCLKGNHEDMLLAAHDAPDWQKSWLSNGGGRTLDSFGVANAADIPAIHIDWLRSLPLFHDDGLRFFVHAGVHPARALDDQSDYDLLEIRKPFLTSKADFGRLVVHGHTPSNNGRPELLPNRLNLDTGAVFGGPLTAAIFDDTSREPIHFIFSDPHQATTWRSRSS